MLLLCINFFFARVIFCLRELRIIIEWEIIIRRRCFIIFELYFDWISLIFFRVVALISGCVFWYRESYIKGDISIRFFLILVLLFVLRIFFIVFRLNLVRIMLGWDGLGVTSYILVVYYKNEKSRAAGIITVLSNRVGDAAILLGIACIVELGRWNFLINEIFRDFFFLSLVGLAAITKRAQIPFSAWLPAAIAAPTPVRALVHSSTLVTAGVYLLIRFREIFKASLVLEALIYLGVFTTLIARIRALFERDLKKIVALSTLRQLGIIIMTLSLGFTKLAFFHLLTHAVFKALLFICSGKVIHIIGRRQDTRSIGGLLFNLPVTRVVINFANYALCGIPFLSGFYSKDILVERRLILNRTVIKYLLLMGVVGFSARYSFRLSYSSFLADNNYVNFNRSEEKDWTILVSKRALLILTATRGAIISWLIVKTPLIIRLPIILKLIALSRTLVGFTLGLGLRTQKIKLISFAFIDKVGFMTILFLPGLRGVLLAKNRFFFAKNLKVLDFGWIEIYGGQGWNRLLLNFSRDLTYSQINNVKYFLVIFMVVLILIYRTY